MMSTIIAVRDWLVRVIESVFLSNPTGGSSLQTQPIPTSFPSPRQKKLPPSLEFKPSFFL